MSGYEILITVGTVALFLSCILAVFSSKDGKTVLWDSLIEDWTERLPFRLRYNRYKGASRFCYQLLVILYYTVKAILILILCAYDCMLRAIFAAIKWIWRKIRTKKQETTTEENEEEAEFNEEWDVNQEEVSLEERTNSFEEILTQTVDQKMIHAANHVIQEHGEGYVVSRQELIMLLRENYQVTEGSIIPSDYCYNRINNGITLSKPTLFEHLGRGLYRCFGEAYPFNGPIYHKEQKIGYCENGVRKIFGIPEPETNTLPEKKARKNRAPYTRLRFEVLARDQFTCRYCGASPTKDPSVTLHIDHIIPWSKGGETTIDNLQTLCSKCNLGKSNMMIETAKE